jgi:NAD(P)-dependent dehydrogenase (short-subunit alcohol dehydrogenase family)
MKTALVTGANRGLGKETARQLEERGLRVIQTSREDPAFPLDVTSDASVRALAEKLRAEKIELDVLVNNAGIAMNGFNQNVVDKTLATNFFGPLRVTDALAPLVRDDGHIVMVSSGMGDLSIFSSSELRSFFAKVDDRDELIEKMREFIADQRGWPQSAYSVSKAGLNALTRILARELPRLRVNAVCPGWVRTDMGGKHAERDVETGAKSIVWGAFTKETGGFFRDGERIAF